ncbi:MAG TPA: hypothetical protein VEH29_15890 [Acidimicrobiales bacterium]|nr:hypothetical protein [Acidimicrobiales bacterium]
MTSAVDRAPRPVTTLRGAGVEADSRRVARVAVGLCLLVLAVVVVVLFLAGARKNDQITRLRESGVAVKVTVLGCRGLMGGSGSNLAGYACNGTFTIGAHRYEEAIPGDAFHPPGAVILARTVPSDPALVTPVGLLKTERATGGVFVLPTILLAILGALGGTLLLRRRRRRGAAPATVAA